MICYDCVLKHLATALSYGKEIIAGHGLGNELDHRIDFLGEITNCEHHLELIDNVLFDEFSTFRKAIQGEDIKVTKSDLDKIRLFFTKVEKLKFNPATNSDFYTELSHNPVIVFEKVTNKNFFDLSVRTIKQNLTDYDKIIVLKSDVVLDDAEVLNKTLKEYVETATEDFILFYENTGINKTISARKIKNSFTYRLPQQSFVKTLEYLRKKEVTGTIGCFDYIKPQKINPQKMNSVLNDYSGDYPVTVYNYLTDDNSMLDDLSCTAFADRKICCGLKQSLTEKHYVRWNETGYEFYLQYLDDNKK